MSRCMCFVCIKAECQVSYCPSALCLVRLRRYLQGRAERVPDPRACWGWLLRRGGACDSNQDWDHHPGHKVSGQPWFCTKGFYAKMCGDGAARPKPWCRHRDHNQGEDGCLTLARVSCSVFLGANSIAVMQLLSVETQDYSVPSKYLRL